MDVLSFFLLLTVTLSFIHLIKSQMGLSTKTLISIGYPSQSIKINNIKTKAGVDKREPISEEDKIVEVVLLYGGKVVSWKNSQGEELLFMSRKAAGRSSKGGISLCFPQLGNTGTIKEICSSKNNVRSLDNIPLRLTPTGNPSSVDLTLKTTANNSNMWPRSFEFRLRVSLGPDKMTMISHIKNTDSTSFSFTIALQNYFSVSDIRTPGNIAIIDHDKKRTIVIRNEGLPDAVLWTPWDNAAKAAASGFCDKDYKMMLSVDSGVLEKLIILKPSEEWKGYQELSIISSSYCSGQLDPKMVAFYAKP
ncbi:Aldose 1-/Glucose-6-phosphate 1-epimerase [Cynara cardunculus var. scolymus]|uniref:Aldose 1-/Glucose-6-phosphate 1-epimerase n=1 Tax=Cynara cardunculus var. scolymus TaxID=59895 RepID=A0A103YAY5_CYNCS|nr:Aldose 1-/Glucose-6-phosphate 1-epimerase [Cynara cardunculus var. scolymus]